MTAAVWCLLAVLAAAGGTALRDRYPRSFLAWLASVAGGAWCFGVMLGFFLLS